MHLYNLIKKFYYRFHLSVRKEFSAMALKSGLQGNIKSHQCTVGLKIDFFVALGTRTWDFSVTMYYAH